MFRIRGALDYGRLPSPFYRPSGTAYRALPLRFSLSSRASYIHFLVMRVRTVEFTISLSVDLFVGSVPAVGIRAAYAGARTQLALQLLYEL